MYAVIESGGKQYRVQPGDIVQVEKLDGDEGAQIKFDKILFCSKGGAEKADIWLGKPYLSGATVQGEIVGQGRGEKILIVKMKRRKQYRRTQGHRQFYTQFICTGVSNGAGETATLSDSDKKAKLDKFQSHLKPKGPAFVTPVLVARRPLEAAPAKPAKKEAHAHADKPAAKHAHAKTDHKTEKTHTKAHKAPASKAKKPAAKKSK